LSNSDPINLSKNSPFFGGGGGKSRTVFKKIKNIYAYNSRPGKSQLQTGMYLSVPIQHALFSLSFQQDF
jgi:hypothetical protein